MLYHLLDTVTYLLSLIILADIQKPSANIIRSLILLCVNYIEVALDFSVLYFLNYFGREIGSEPLKFSSALMAGFFGEKMSEVAMECVADYGLYYADQGIKFFFLTLAFGYFANHLRQRKFRQNEDVV